MIGRSVTYYKMDRLPIPMQAQQEKHMDHDTVALRNKAASLIIEMYFGAGQVIDATHLAAEAEVLYQWLLTGAKDGQDTPA